MKVLFWLSMSFDRHTTSQHLLTAIIRSLCEQGHSVHILQKDTNGPLPAIPEELNGYAITTDCVPFQYADKSNFIARYLGEIRYIRACKKYITSDFDAVFIQSTPAGGYAVKTVRSKNAHAIVTYNVQDIFPYNAYYTGKLKKNSIPFKILSSIQRYGYTHSDHVITISEDMKETLVSDGVNEDKIEVIYNWSYQDEVYEDIDLHPVEHIFNKNYFNVVYAGNIGMMQNVDLLIETAAFMKDHKDIWFHIIGDGLYKEKLVKKSEALSITNISFWPLQVPELAPAIYLSADVNVIPLAKNIYKTALPSKTATCLACGKPIVFAIGRESKFGQKIESETSCIVIDSDGVAELAKSLNQLKNITPSNNIEIFYKKYFVKSVNSKAYAKIISHKG